MTRKAVVLLSGGMDSVTALYWTQRHLELMAAISFHYGAKHNDREIPFAVWHCKQLGVRHQRVDLPFIGELFQSHLLQSGGEIPEGHYEDETMKATVVPFRNGIMLAIAAGFAESIGATELVIAAHAGDHAIYPDCREEFMRAMAEAVSQGTYAQITIQRPFIHDRKERIAALGAAWGVDFRQTWSCYKGGAVHCGKCGTCWERQEAFVRAGLPDPTIYESSVVRKK